jgi:hypothetical protein
MLVCTRSCYVIEAQWGVKQYMNMKHLENHSTEEPESGNLTAPQPEMSVEADDPDADRGSGGIAGFIRKPSSHP